MTNKISPYLQYLLPQHLISTLVGKLADSQQAWLKNILINQFIKRYHVNMSEALLENPEEYPTFNSFFIRQLKPEARPIDPSNSSIISPVDGIISQIGKIHEKQLLQAKDFYFDLDNLLGHEKQLSKTFTDGSFAILYLAPKDYHRVHMPITGKLKKTIYVPGKLFSVNRITSEIIPGLYSRNERLISLFETEIGEVAVILVGALIVGTICTMWSKEPIKNDRKEIHQFTNDHTLIKGEELGYFKMGSTVILLFEQNKINWSPFEANSSIQLGQILGHKNK